MERERTEGPDATRAGPFSFPEREPVRAPLAALFVAQFFSQFGDSVFQLAFIWLVLELTGSKSATGLAAMISYLPPLVFGVAAGLMVDRLNRKLVMVWADAARAFLLAVCGALYAAHVLSPALLIAFAFGTATSAVLFYPARDSILPELVPRAALPRANAWVQLSQQAAFFFGPMAAGLLIRRFGVQAAFPTGAACFVGSLLALLFLGGAGSFHRSGEERIGLAQDFRSGLATIARDRTLVLLLTLTALDNLFVMGPAIVGIAVLVRETLHRDASAYALVDAMYGVGMVAGSLVLSRVGSKVRSGRLLLIGITLDGLTHIPVYFCRTLDTLVPVVLVHALMIPAIVVPRATLVQGMVPSRLQGRVFALVNVVVLGTTAISSGLTGLALDRITAPVLFAVTGALAAATGLMGFAFPRLRRL